MFFNDANITYSVTKEQLKALNKAERDRQRDKRRTLSMLDKLDIDTVKIPKDLVAMP